MDRTAPAEELPGRYRAILDGVDVLESRGMRRDASRIRAAASRSYSRAWDERSLRALDDLIREIERLVARPMPPSPPSTGFTLTRRSSAPR